MHIEVVRDTSGFSMLRTEWNDLLSRSLADTIFLTWEWVFSWWQSYAKANDSLYIITVRDTAGQLIGIFPFYRRAQRWLPLKPMNTLRFIGDGSWDSDYLDAILIDGREEEILASVWQWLSAQRSTWNLIQVEGIPETSPTCGWLKRAAQSGQIISRTDSVACLVADLPNSWEEYVGSLKPRFRTKVRSTLREITARHDVSLRAVETATELKAGLELLYDLHGKRWESKGIEGVFASATKRQFYERFAPLFLAEGWLAFDFLELNGKAVACQLCFKYRDTQFLLQEGFDPEFASESVGIALRAMVLRKAIENGIQHYDFLAGLGRHKTQWQARTKHCRKISLGPRTVQNTIYLKLPTAMEALRERIKVLLPAKVLQMRRRLAAS
jgi:CelD/BcsL family acetyltransferase involved in cellulose biosynthesis